MTASNSFVVFTNTALDGSSEVETWPANTEEEIAAIRAELAERDEPQIVVWVGDPDCPDSYETDLVIFRATESAPIFLDDFRDRLLDLVEAQDGPAAAAIVSWSDDLLHSLEMWVINGGGDFAVWSKSPHGYDPQTAIYVQTNAFSGVIVTDRSLVADPDLAEIGLRGTTAGRYHRVWDSDDARADIALAKREDMPAPRLR